MKKKLLVLFVLALALFVCSSVLVFADDDNVSPWDWDNWSDDAQQENGTQQPSDPTTGSSSTTDGNGSSSGEGNNGSSTGEGGNGGGAATGGGSGTSGAPTDNTPNEGSATEDEQTGSEVDETTTSETDSSDETGDPATGEEGKDDDPQPDDDSKDTEKEDDAPAPEDVTTTGAEEVIVISPSKGCFGVISGLPVVFAIAATAAILASKKRKED